MSARKKTRKVAIRCVHTDGELIKLADKLAESIENACWQWEGMPNLSRPTLNMFLAIHNYRAYKARINA